MPAGVHVLPLNHASLLIGVAIRWDTATGTFPAGMHIVRAIDFDGGQRDEIVGKIGQDLVVFKFQ